MPESLWWCASPYAASFAHTVSFFLCVSLHVCSFTGALLDGPFSVFFAAAIALSLLHANHPKNSAGIVLLCAPHAPARSIKREACRCARQGASAARRLAQRPPPLASLSLAPSHLHRSFLLMFRSPPLPVTALSLSRGVLPRPPFCFPPFLFVLACLPPHAYVYCSCSARLAGLVLFFVFRLRAFP